MSEAEWKCLTLEDLEDDKWGEPQFLSSLVTRCHALRRKPVGEFTTGDLRVVIGQGIGLEWLVPLALDVLERDPMVDGDHYEGDLLLSVLGTNSEYWLQNTVSRSRLNALIPSAEAAVRRLEADPIREHLEKAILKGVKRIVGGLG